MENINISDNSELQKEDINKQFYFFKRISIVDKYNFYEYLSVMLDWWVSIVESLESVESKISSLYFKEKIKEIITYISSWDSFSKSMKKMPYIFSNSEISVIEAWETTWMLTVSLLKLSDDLKKIHNLKNKIKGALTYPMIIFMFLFIALIIVLTFVIPSLKSLFETTEVELPFATKLLINTSDFVVNNAWLLVLLIISLIVIFYWYFVNSNTWRKKIEEFLLSVPLIWKVYRNYILSNIASTLWSLIWAWVNMIKTLKLVWKSTNNLVYEQLFEEIVIKVSAWEKIVKSMELVDPEKRYFPADYLQMLSVWERTANIETIAKKLNSQYTKEVDYSLANLTKWIEPLAILLASVFVLWFAYAILWAVLKMTSAVG